MQKDAECVIGCKYLSFNEIKAQNKSFFLKMM